MSEPKSVACAWYVFDEGGVSGRAEGGVTGKAEGRAAGRTVGEAGLWARPMKDLG